MPTATIKAFANCDHVIIVWSYVELIPNCIGFALYKATNGESKDTAEPLPNRIGFAGQNPQPGEQRPSTEWPIQRFLWTDYDVNYKDTVSYMVVPICLNGTSTEKDTANASGWTDVVSVSTGTDDYEAYFNRGIISSQFMSRQIATLKTTDKTATLDDTLKDPNSTIRKFMGGVLAQKFYDELDAVVNDPSLSIYSALYELNEVNIVEKLKTIGSRAHIVLANGAFNSSKPDENADVRQELKAAGVNVYDRLVTGSHFAHNKFTVFCKDEEPFKVLTGSTNVTENGFYTQVNNAVFINRADVAKWYRDEWDQIKAAGSGYPADYMAYNTQGHPASSDLTTWFAPVNNLVDMNMANNLIQNAQDGILFLMFNPGPNGTLYDTILSMIDNKPDLFVHGILNQNPFGKVHPLVFLNKGQSVETNFDAILPKKVTDEFAYWSAEVTGKMVVIHSKVVVIDPFGANPVVMFGSHNMGPKASKENDDNLNIVVGNKSLAQQYAVNILSVYDHFRWRYSMSQQSGTAHQYSGLSTDPNWMQSYSNDQNLKQLKFFGVR